MNLSVGKDRELSVNLTANPFIIPPNRTELSAEAIRSNQEARQKNLANNSNQTNIQATQTSAVNNRNIFTLSASQTQKISGLRNNESDDRSSQNRPISQYLQTESLRNQEELDTLVRLDVFA